jgi:hypothetical protein
VGEAERTRRLGSSQQLCWHIRLLCASKSTIAETADSSPRVGESKLTPFEALNGVDSDGLRLPALANQPVLPRPSPPRLSAPHVNTKLELQLQPQLHLQLHTNNDYELCRMGESRLSRRRYYERGFQLSTLSDESKCLYNDPDR